MEDDSEILDENTLEHRGHTETQIAWLLSRAPHGEDGRRYLTADAYERLLVDLPPTD